MGYLYLGIAIVAEVVATTALKASESFTVLWPSVIVCVGYGVCFYTLSLALQFISIGVAYAIWCGLGIVLITATGAIFYGQSIDLPAVLGMGLIMAGVAVIHLFSKASSQG